MFTAKDKKLLSLFCEVCDCVAGRRLMRDLHKYGSYVCIGRMPDGRVMDEYPRYDDDDFRAFMVDYRKLRLEQEDTNLLRVMNLLKWKGDPADRGLLDHLRSEIKEEGRAWWGAVDRGEDGSRRFLTQVEVEGLILYGEVVHCDRKAQLRRVIGDVSYLKAAAVFNYMRFAWTVIHCAQKVADLIRSKGYPF